MTLCVFSFDTNEWFRVLQHKNKIRKVRERFVLSVIIDIFLTTRPTKRQSLLSPTDGAVPSIRQVIFKHVWHLIMTVHSKLVLADSILDRKLSKPCH